LWGGKLGQKSTKNKGGKKDSITSEVKKLPIWERHPSRTCFLGRTQRKGDVPHFFTISRLKKKSAKERKKNLS